MIAFPITDPLRTDRPEPIHISVLIADLMQQVLDEDGQLSLSVDAPTEEVAFQ